MKRTPLARGDKPPERKTELKRAWFNRGTRETKAKATKKPATNGPTKPRLESSEIPQAIRLAAYARDEWRCMRCGIYIPDSGLRWGLQHRKPRKLGGSRLLHTLPNLVLLCGWSVDKGTCTEAVELLDRPRATAEGWLVPDGQITPEVWRVRRWTPDGPVWMQPGTTWEVAEPHPRQRELLGKENAA